MSQKQVMPKSEDLSRSLEINAIWTFDTEFPTIFNKSCTYITFKSAVKHRHIYKYIHSLSRRHISEKVALVMISNADFVNDLEYKKCYTARKKSEK